MTKISELIDISNMLRRDVIKATSMAGSGHLSSCMSCAEIISCLFFEEMGIDRRDAFNPNNDEFILSKGHAAPILYSALYRSGMIHSNPISLRRIKSPLEGHPIPCEHLPWVKVATGSLGQGLSAGVGMALAGKKQGKNFRTYVLMGDSEFAEGSVYEALEIGAHYKLNNLIAIIDVNRLGQRGETLYGYNLGRYKEILKSFGWNALVIDGHKIKHILWALQKAKSGDKPTAIIARTIKGKGVRFIENINGWHGKVLSPIEMKIALRDIPEREFPKLNLRKVKKDKNAGEKLIVPRESFYKTGEEVSTREAYGDALANLAGLNKNVYAIDAEVSNSTFADKVKEKSSEQFIEAYIAEQNMISMALGMSKKGLNVFASSFAAFLTRAHDQIRMAALSKPNFTIVGSHAGVSIGEDGASQMGLDDIAMLRAMPNSIILYPSDGVSAEKLTYLAAKTHGLKYIRITRGKTPVIYKNNEVFKLGDFKVLKESAKDRIVLIGAGITVRESLKAYNLLKEKGVKVGVVDLYCIKPLDVKKLGRYIKEHGGNAVITEDHYKEGGIGESVMFELMKMGIKLKHLYVSRIAHSGTPEELLDLEGIDAEAIVKACSAFV